MTSLFYLQKIKGRHINEALHHDAFISTTISFIDHHRKMYPHGYPCSFVVSDSQYLVQPNMIENFRIYRQVYCIKLLDKKQSKIIF